MENEREEEEEEEEKREEEGKASFLCDDPAEFLPPFRG